MRGSSQGLLGKQQLSGGALKLLVMTPAEAALHAGFAPVHGNAPDHSATARLLRAAVLAAGPVSRRGLLERIVADAVFVGFEAEPVHVRAGAVLALLEAAGDLVVVRAADRDLILHAPESTVLTRPNAAVLVGGVELGSDVPTGDGAGSFLRVAPDARTARPWEDFVGPATWRDAVRKVGLSGETGLQDALRLLVLAVKVRGEVAEVSAAGVWGKLDDMGGGFGVLGDGREAVFVMSQDGRARAIAIPDIACWAALSVWGFDVLSDWRFPLPVPFGLLRALVFHALPDDDGLRQWNLSREASELLENWAGVPEVRLGSGAPDRDQDEIVGTPAADRLLVEAPPGSGKTWTACRRVGALVDAGTPPARIWMLSFTRVAVAELRSRIAGLLRDPGDALDLRIVTVDSLAWRLRHGFGDVDAVVPGGHEASIDETLRLFEEGDSGLADFVGDAAPRNR
jgi:DNA helicase-2/ATP-dependent DNA helicase PcrA